MTAIEERIDNAVKKYHFTSSIHFDTFSEEERKTFFEKTQLIKLKKKEVLFEQDTYSRGVYIVKSGKIKVHQINFDGSNQILFVYSAGDLFGYRNLITSERNNVWATALEPSEIELVPADTFLYLLKTSNTLNQQLLRAVSDEFTILTNRINIFAQRGIKERLSLALLILNKKYTGAETNGYFSEITLSRKDLADYVGTSIENIVRTIQYFKQKKLIKTIGKSIVITHPENLLILSGIYY
jgi:CRP-like cAMP-binding protein